ncbi:tail tape measure protein [Vibrio phage VAP7]|uniref:Tail tape measure protein n=1 Tax=Vibrio phage VAP7 TaxID=2584487 RepID=A0A4Y5TV40_9CAUD|nr:tail tape measure protein [Vibrio phage VAP7]QDB73222.1 tail tape measure protein [Vibrio phage VAP7]UFD98093.1 hypothetical protein [Vibrio phage BX-1]
MKKCLKGLGIIWGGGFIISQIIYAVIGLIFLFVFGNADDAWPHLVKVAENIATAYLYGCITMTVAFIITFVRNK